VCFSVFTGAWFGVAADMSRVLQCVAADLSHVLQCGAWSNVAADMGRMLRVLQCVAPGCTGWALHVCDMTHSAGMCLFCTLKATASNTSSTPLQHTATHCNTLQHTATRCNTLQDTGIFLYLYTQADGKQRFERSSMTLQHTATHCNTLQHTATHCNTLQHAATRCNTQVSFCICTRKPTASSASSAPL